MSVVETEQHGQVLVVRMNRPERLNALNHEIRVELARVWTEFRHDDGLEVAILTGTGRAFCAGEDMKESLAEKNPGGRPALMEDPFNAGTLEKPVIAAVNGFAMGGGFMMVERTDLRVAASTAIFEVSEAKRWLLGGYNHGHMANLAFPLAMEMAPAGRCRPAVRGFNASNRRSTIRLKAMAQVRPLTMAARTSKKTFQPGHPR